MAKTALGLTTEEWKAYQPGAVAADAEPYESASGRRQAAWDLARQAARILRLRFGASKVMVFGSQIEGVRFTRWSDVDLAVWGIAPDPFYQAVAVVTGLSSDFKVDIIDPETCRPALLDALEREGVVL